MERVNVFTVKTVADPDDPPGYEARRRQAGADDRRRHDRRQCLRPGAAARACARTTSSSARRSGCSCCAGRPTLRRAGGDGELEEELEPGDTICFPPGPSGAHKVTNGGEAPVRILMLSTMPEVDISYYPDSEKYGVWPDGGANGFLVRRESAVDYYDGER